MLFRSCGIERAYVHESVFDAFVDGAIGLVKSYVLDDPSKEETTLGPLVKPSAARFAREQVSEAVGQGAVAHIDSALFGRDEASSAYMAPQLLTQVSHKMRVMTEETFGPVLGIQAVRNDEEAIALMNDSDYGLTAAVFTEDQEAAISIGNRVNTGTWFMNRCDYLDPALAWTGVKHSGRGCKIGRAHV